jgi:hypothetical protein
MTLEMQDLDALKDVALQRFDTRVADLSVNGEERIVQEVARLQAELEQIYRVVVLLQKNETGIDRVAELWAKMVAICDTFARRISVLAHSYPSARISHDRILDLRTAAEERRQLHSRP